MIEERATDVLVSAVTVWEIEIKRATGKLRAPADMLDSLERTMFRPLSISWVHGLAAGGLPCHHGDPFDRMLVAQAQLEGLTLVTRDPVFRNYAVAVLAA
jgi:PIN domain nuclease of toxin-antitoxin system